jgi:hypothetical protein
MRLGYTVAQLYGLPHGILHVFNTIFYENEFQNTQNQSFSRAIYFTKLRGADYCTPHWHFRTFSTSLTHSPSNRSY